MQAEIYRWQSGCILSFFSELVIVNLVLFTVFINQKTRVYISLVIFCFCFEVDCAGMRI